MKIYIVIFFMISNCLLSLAQDLTVHSFTEMPNDITAKKEPHEDFNGVKCALIKVFIESKEAYFDGNVVDKLANSDNEYWVYMPKGTRRLTVKVPSYHKLEISFDDWNVKFLKEETTYSLIIDTSKSKSEKENTIDYWASPIDLGLSVKWAACNVGADSPEQDGELYAWGETEAKKNYDYSTYKYCRGEENTFTKYCWYDESGTPDGIGTLEAEDDVAQIKYGKNWRTPSRKDLYELYKKCTWKLQFYNKKKGYAVTGPNGNSIFLPLPGYMIGDSCVKKGKEGRYMTSDMSLDYNEYMSELDVNGDTNSNYVSHFNRLRINGYSVRPVWNDIQTKDDKITHDEIIDVNGVQFKMVYVEGGTFTMGATPEQKEEPKENERPAHSVFLVSYYIGETEVTQDLWQAIMGNNPSKTRGIKNPVEYVSWHACKNFIQKLNAITGRKFRLPTEAEWEYAARGGIKSKGYQYSGSENWNEVAWTNTFSDKTVPVKFREPNEIGIYGMSGNVQEWCEDWYGDYHDDFQINPQGANSGTHRVYRGGSYCCHYSECRVARRHAMAPEKACIDLGFRLVLTE